MTFGLRCSGPARRPHPASLPVRVPTVEGLPPASFSFASRLRLAVQLRLPSSAPIGSFHPIRFCPCWAHPAASRLIGTPAGVLQSASRGVGGALWARQTESLRHVGGWEVILEWSLTDRRPVDCSGCRREGPPAARAGPPVAPSAFPAGFPVRGRLCALQSELSELRSVRIGPREVCPADSRAASAWGTRCHR
jgi:hypothetical protein